MAATRQLLFGYTIKIGRENKEKEGRIKLKRDPALKTWCELARIYTHAASLSRPEFQRQRDGPRGAGSSLWPNEDSESEVVRQGEMCAAPRNPGLGRSSRTFSAFAFGQGMRPSGASVNCLVK